MMITYYKKDKGIISLGVVFSIGFIALAAALTTMTGTLAEIKKNRNNISGSQSFYTAESAANEGARQYIHNPASYSGGDSELINNSLISDITVTPMDWPYVKVAGLAEDNNTARKVSYIFTVFPEGLIFDYAVASDFDLALGGSIAINGDVFANNNISFNGTNAEINGNAYSANEITDTDNINGEAIFPVDMIQAPEINLGAYRETAIAGGTFFTDPADAENYLNNQSRIAVVFVSGGNKTKIQGNGTNLMGSIATEGDLEITGGTYSATDNYAALVVEGNLRIAGGATINGIVYVKGLTSFGGGNNVINGSLIAVHETNVDITGNTVINYDAGIAQSWPDLFGLETTSNSTPRIIQWQEE